MENGTVANTRTAQQSRPLSVLNGPWPVVILLVLFWWMSVSAKVDVSVTYDELPHLTGGYSYWVTNDYRLQPENGNLSQRWVAIPLLFSQYQFPSLDLLSWAEANVWGVGYVWFYWMSNDLSTMLLSGRAMMALMAVGLGVLVYAWARSLFRPPGGLLALLLFVFCPSLLAHGSLMTSDLPVTLFLSAAVWSFWMLLHHVSVRTILIASLAMAGALLSKLSGLVFIPIALVLLVIRLVAQRPLRISLFRERHARTPLRQLAVLGPVIVVHVMVAVTVLWGFYGFRYSAFASVRGGYDHFLQPRDEALPLTVWSNPTMQFARDHHLLPEAYLYGFAFALWHTGSRRAFLNGEHREEGWWYFFPYALLVKTPLPFFVLLAAAAAALTSGRRPAGATASFSPDHAAEIGYSTIPLGVLLAVYWGFSLTSHLNIGQRHILPTYPAMFILAGAAALWFQRPSMLMKGLVTASLIWFMVESVSIRPHYLAYFNQVAGGPSQGYRHLVDSSLDWGQDLLTLKRRLERHEMKPGHPPVYLAYFGKGSPAYYGTNARLLTEVQYDSWSTTQEALKPLTGGVYAVSVTILQTVPLRFWGPWTDSYERMYRTLLAELEEYRDMSRDPGATRSWLAEKGGSEAWEERLAIFNDLRLGRLLAYLRTREPDDQVGYSILIYRLSDEQVETALHGPAP